MKHYYLLTPVFVLLDFALNINVRTAFLDAYSEWKIPYYILCICIGLLYVFRPLLADFLSIVECVVSVLLLTGGVIVHYYQAVAMYDTELRGVITSPLQRPEYWLNYLICGAALAWDFYTNPLIRRDRSDY
jgi:hypothetical protein